MRNKWIAVLFFLSLSSWAQLEYSSLQILQPKKMKSRTPASTPENLADQDLTIQMKKQTTPVETPKDADTFGGSSSPSSSFQNSMNSSSPKMPLENGKGDPVTEEENNDSSLAHSNSNPTNVVGLKNSKEMNDHKLTLSAGYFEQNFASKSNFQYRDFSTNMHGLQLEGRWKIDESLATKVQHRFSVDAGLEDGNGMRDFKFDTTKVSLIEKTESAGLAYGITYWNKNLNSPSSNYYPKMNYSGLGADIHYEFLVGSSKSGFRNFVIASFTPKTWVQESASGIDVSSGEKHSSSSFDFTTGITSQVSEQMQLQWSLQYHSTQSIYSGSPSRSNRDGSSPNAVGVRTQEFGVSFSLVLTEF